MPYLDHAATTPLRPAARKAWLDAADICGNASSVHGAGRAARRTLEDARESVAADLGVAASGVVFTSGGTESDNLAVVGGFRARRAADPDRRLIVLSRVEHKAVLDPAAALAAEAETVWLDVDDSGRTDPDQLEQILRRHRRQIAVVAVMWANNEVGAVQPIAEIAGLCADAGVPLHTDAVQALGNVPVAAGAAATAAFSGHKVGGPTGVGILTIDPAAAVEPLLRGGGQESGMRPGTADVAGVAALAAAVREAVAGRGAHADRLRALRRRLLDGIQRASAGPEGFDFIVNGTDRGVRSADRGGSTNGDDPVRGGGAVGGPAAAGGNADPAVGRNDLSLPGLASVSFPGCDADALMMLLDAEGIAVSTGSACSVGIPKPSHVLAAMGSPHAARTLRFSLGWNSTEADVDAAVAALPRAVARARLASGVLAGAR